MPPIINVLLCKCENCQKEPKFLKHTYTEFRPENRSWKNRTIWYPNPRYIHNRAIIRQATGTLYPNPTRIILSTYRGFQISIPASFNLPKTFHHDKVITDYHQYIDDYYQHNDNIIKRELAFPYHHSLVQLSLLLSSTRFIHSAYGMYRPYNRQPIHNTKPLSSITMLKLRQRTTLLGFSGITGLLIPRLLGRTPYWQRHTFESMGTHIVRRIHSPIACEIMLDNRYSDFVTEKNALRCELNDVPINRARRLLRVVYYDGHTLASLKKDIADFKRGKISIDVIYNNQTYRYLYTYWYYCLSESMHYHNQTDIERREKCLPRESMFQKTKRIIRIITEFSEMLSPDIVFIMKTNRLAYMIKNTQLRLSKDGCFAAFLAFSKLEPLMVDDMMAPIIGTQYTGIEQNKAKTNWIPSKDRVFGDLILKHREHLPTTANVSKVICRHNLAEKLVENSDFD